MSDPTRVAELQIRRGAPG